MKYIFMLPLLGGLLLNSSTICAQSNNPFSVTSYGSFTQMIKLGEAPDNASLFPMRDQVHLYGLGALESLHGEITIIDGNLLISRGIANDGHTTQVTPKDNATLLATAVVKNWISVPTPSNLDQASFEKFVLLRAYKAGIPKNVPFPFLVKGEIKNLHWHVVTGLSQAAQNHAHHPEKKQFESESTEGTLLGFYTAKQLEGIISHPNERFHIHYTNIKLSHAGHLDSYEIGANATLYLPVLQTRS